MRSPIRWLLVVAGVALWLALPSLLPGRESVLVLLTLYIPPVLGVVLLAGYTGQVSVGQAAFFGMGAYGTGILSVRAGLDPWAAMPVAVAATAVVAWGIGRPLLLLRGQYVVLATLGFNVIFIVLATQLDSLTGGASGLLGIQPLELGGEPLLSNRDFFIAGSAVALASVLLSRRLVRSRVGRALQAIEGSEAAASSLGVDRTRHATQVFVWSAAMAAASGALYAEWVRFISPSAFSVDISIELLIMATIGGIASIGGAVVGTGLFLAARELLRELLPALGAGTGSSAELELIAFGVILAVSTIFLPGGVWPWGVATAQRTGLFSAASAESAEHAAPLELEAAAPAGDAPVLRVDGLTQRFGGLTALNDVSVAVAPSSILAIIGPNGAGKSTFLNVVSGLVAPTSGRIEIAGAAFSGPPHRVAQAGVARTFQTPRLFPLLDVADNVRVGLHRHLRAGFVRSVLGLSRIEERRARRSALAALETVGLAVPGHARVTDLPFGQQRLVELARAIAARPGLLLLDEPASGLAAEERDALKDLIQQIRDGGTAVVLVEHDVPLVMDVADRIVVLHHGTKLAEGTPHEIAANEDVMAAYLGTAGAASRRTRAAEPSLAGAPSLLELRNVRAGYGQVPVLTDVNLQVHVGEIVGLLGPNGAGKTTTTRALMGLLPSAGDRLFDGAPLSTPEGAVARGLTLVPEGRELLGSMTVEDHLRLGAYAVRRRARTAADLQRVDALFPILAERRRQSAASLSGGQQQMLAIARALMSGPRMLVVDEPLLGLAPLVVEDILDAIVRLAADGVSVLLVEQNAATVLPILDRAYVLEQGRIVAERDPAELRHSLERGVARAAPIP